MTYNGIILRLIIIMFSHFGQWKIFTHKYLNRPYDLDREIKFNYELFQRKINYIKRLDQYYNCLGNIACKISTL